MSPAPKHLQLLHHLHCSTSSILGSLEPFLAAKGEGGREKFQEVGVASPTQWELFLAIFHCAANGKDHGYICVSDCPGELTFPSVGLMIFTSQ